MAEIDKKLLEILVCPVSKKSLVLNEETNELICEVRSCLPDKRRNTSNVARRSSKI